MDKDVISAAHKGLGALDSELGEEINALFEAIDHDHSGALSRAEVAQLLTDQNIVVESSYLDGLLDAYDLDQSGEITRPTRTRKIGGKRERESVCVRVRFVPR